MAKDIYFSKRIPRADQVRDWYYGKYETKSSYEKAFELFQGKFLQAQKEAISKGLREVYLRLETDSRADGAEPDFEEYLDGLGYKVTREDVMSFWDATSTYIIGYRYVIKIEW